jgi:cell division protein FtsA
LIVYCDGMVTHTGVVPIGGDHFTNDVAVGLRTPLVAAEKIKKSFGHALSSEVANGNEIEVPAVGDRPSRLLPQRFLAEIIEPRAAELCEMLRDHLRQAGVLELCNAGLVLAGGGSRLNGLAQVCESVTRRPVRVASPATIAKMPAQLAEPEFAALVGLAIYTHRTSAAKVTEMQGFGYRLRSWFAKLGA